MNYINIENNSVVSLSIIRRENPNISFPRSPSDDALNPLGYAVVHPTERPAGDVVTQGQPVQGEDGKWYQTWEVRDFTPEELKQQRQASLPQSITPRQARLALLHAGLLSQVDTAISSLDSPAKEQAQIEWEYATSIERSSEWINQLGTALGLDDAGIDDLFKTASTL